MNPFKVIFVTLYLTLFMSLNPAYANSETNLVANQGYDLVSYFQTSGPMRGTGDHVVYRNGVAYLFATDENKKAFAENPEKYLPAYGGYCAFGVAVGKKIVSDPLAWKIVDGKLYLNLNKNVAVIWSKDIPGYIKKAELNWPNIKDKDPQGL